MAQEQSTYLTGFRLMWVMCLFDLPTNTPQERRAYTQFRDHLLDQGFEMAQYSVYVRHTSGKEAVEAIIKKIEAAVPAEGKIDILQFTDKQYENIVCLRGKRRAESPKNPEQFVMF
jgi:CRISPR-associated protein Cas2